MKTAKYWTSPEGYSWTLCDEILDGVHCLIAGTPGSGKSVLMHSIIFSALADLPTEKKFILCDPKRVELMRYKNLPHVLRAETEPAGIVDALEYVSEVMYRRYEIMEKSGSVRFSDGPEIYVFIDELADLMLSPERKRFTEVLCKILRLARAAGIHCIFGSQAPNRKILTAELLLNVPMRVGLRCISPIESKQIINRAGCENLPRYGTGYLVSACDIRKVKIPMTPDADIKERIAFWEAQV